MNRSGPESLTLGAVEEEAGLPPATVDAHFADASQLLLAIVADDLAQFARRLGEQEPHAVSAIAEISSSSQNDAGGEAGATAQAAQQDFAKLQAAVTRLEARPVDAWLERRLREFERGLAAIDSKLAGAENASAQIALEESVRSLSTRLETLEAKLAEAAGETLPRIAERLNASQDQCRQEHSDIDTMHARIARRIDALENAAFAAAPAFFQHPPHDDEPAAPRAGAVAETISPLVQPGAVPDNGTQPVPASSFLSAARRSAQEAQLRAQTEKPPLRNSRNLSRRALYWIAGGLTVLVGLIWTKAYVTAQEVAALPAIEAKSPAHAVVASIKRAHLPTLSSDLTQANSARADLVIGLSFLKGPRRNDAVAAKWLSLSAQKGNALAAFKLATLYRDGRGVSADAVAAFHWNKFAANARNCNAMHNLAVAYAEGWGTAKNYAAAVRWFAQAASLGVTDSQFNLGVMYERGLGVPSSLADAYKWYLIAAAQGDRQAELRVAALKPGLDSSDLAAAEEAAAAFRPASRDRDANEIPRVSASSPS